MTIPGFTSPLTVALVGGAIVLLAFAGPVLSRAGGRQLQATVGKLIPYMGVIFFLYLGTVIFGPLWGLSDIQFLGVLGVAVVVIYVVTTSGQTLSIPFWLTAPTLLLAVVQYLFPDIVTAAFDPVLNFFGLSVGPFDGLQLVILGFGATLVYWVIQFRAGGGANNADSVFSYIAGGEGGRQGALPKLVGQYFTIGRLAVGAGFAITALLFVEGGNLAGRVVGILGDAPLVASNLATAAFGYLALGGDVPSFLAWIPGVEPLAASIGATPTTFLILSLVLAGAAYGIKDRIERQEMRIARAQARAREDDN